MQTLLIYLYHTYYNLQAIKTLGAIKSTVQIFIIRFSYSFFALLVFDFLVTILLKGLLNNCEYNLIIASPAALNDSLYTI